MTDNAPPPQHWSAMARSWEQSGSPLRPSPEDVAAYESAARAWIDRHGAPRVLLLGVTPEIYRLPWPLGNDFIAVDRTAAMIEHIWPGRREQVTQAGWTELPLPSASRDLAFCDGGLHLLDYPAGQQALVARLHDVISPGGRVIFRLFIPPAVRESPAAVVADLLARRIPNLNLLKLRLGMALQNSAEAGVAVRDVWQRLRDLAPDWATLAPRLGWPLEHLESVDAYRDSGARYHFVTREQAADLFCAGEKFALLSAATPTYALGERCPLVVFERLPSAAGR
jgi:SAM-dependent methyltransferase